MTSLILPQHYLRLILNQIILFRLLNIIHLLRFIIIISCQIQISSIFLVLSSILFSKVLNLLIEINIARLIELLWLIKAPSYSGLRAVHFRLLR